jgi:chromosome partitioning protein
MTKILTVANEKGGVAKTTIAVNVAHGLARMGHNVLICDFDPQGDAAVYLGGERDQGVYQLLAQEIPSLKALIRGDPVEITKSYIKPTGRSNLFVLAGNSLTANAKHSFSGMQNLRIDLTSHAIDSLIHGMGFDYVVIDTPPIIDIMLDQVIWASDGVLIPTTCEKFALEGVTRTYSLLGSLAENWGWKGGLVGVVPTIVGNLVDHTEGLRWLQENFPAESLLTVIHRYARVGELPSYVSTVYERSYELPSDEGLRRAAAEFTQLTKAVKTRL